MKGTNAMARQAVAKWRESASLIILAKNRIVQPNDCDYKVLMFKRAAKASFMANSAVFPGGVLESTDESPLWLEHFRSFGYPAERLQQLTNVSGSQSAIFTKHGEDCLKKDISQRIGAIRETFEEVGVLLCRLREAPRTGTKNSVGVEYGNVYEDFDRAYWQHLVHGDHSQFLTLCRELDVVPDVWSLHEWSAWLTPSVYAKRFKTAFYLAALPSIPEVLLEQNEVSEFTWKTPLDYLNSHMEQEILLPSPQFYELSRLLNFSQLNKLIDFAHKRAANGVTLFLPVQCKCTDGIVSLMPGDDMYPTDPNATSEMITTNVTLEEFRAGVKKLHRAEFVGLRNCTVHLNVDPSDGHLKPLKIQY